MNKITGLVRRCVEDYSMIEDGDDIAVGVSGGKDSLLLLMALADLRNYYPMKYKLHAITLDMGFEGMDFTEVKELCSRLDVPHYTALTNIKEVVFDERKEKNPCSLCAKMRRGALNNAIRDRGIKKLALGHHFDDAVETFFLCLFYEGRISCFEPVTYLDRSGVTQLRPMLYVGEQTVKNTVRRLDLPVVQSTCEHNGISKRDEIKTLISTLSATYPDLKNKIFRAMQRYPLKGWEPAEYTRRPLP